MKDTIFNNLTIGNRNATAETLDEVCKNVKMSEYIKNSDYGYNMRLGGEHGFHYTQEQKEKLGETLRNNSHKYKHTQKIRCKETGDIFGTVADAKRWANTSHISDVLNGRRKYAGRNPETG